MKKKVEAQFPVVEESELLRAVARIGGPVEGLRWLLRFAQADLPKLTSGQWVDLGAELIAFTLWGPVGSASSQRRPQQSAEKSLLSALNVHNAPRVATAFWGTHPLPQPLIAKAQGLLRSGIESVLQTGAATFPPVQLNFSIHKGHKSPLFVVSANALPRVFAYRAACLLGEYMEGIRRCAECQTLFLIDRRDQKYCSTRCLSRVSQRRFQARLRKKKKRRGKGSTRQQEARVHQDLVSGTIKTLSERD